MAPPPFALEVLCRQIRFEFVSDELISTSGSAFPSTQWSLISRAREGVDEDRDQALETLCGMYWLPLYSFVRKKGLSTADAEDATQGFLASFLHRGDFSRLDQADGRMRTYLLRSFTNFLNCEYRFKSRIKRGGGIPNLSIQEMESEGRYQDLPSENATPATLFDRAWAIELLERILAQLESLHIEKGKESEFQLLKPYLRPTGNEPSHKEIAEQIGVESPAVKAMVFRLRQQYREMLFEAVRETLTEGADVEDEIQHLMDILAA